MEEEDHFHSTQLPSLIAALASATQGNRAVVISNPSLFLSSLFCCTIVHTLLYSLGACL
jgi:hypothetical protein